MTLASLRTIFLLVGVFYITGCAKQSKRIMVKDSETAVAVVQSNEEVVAELEAKLYDIPLPFNSCNGSLLSSYSSAQDPIILHYTVSGESSELVDFYKKEMELLGWRETASAQGTISFIMFDKPGRWAAFEIKKQALLDDQEIQELVIFTGQRSESEATLN